MLWHFRNKNADENNFARITIPKLLPHYYISIQPMDMCVTAFFEMMILDTMYISKYKMKSVSDVHPSQCCTTQEVSSAKRVYSYPMMSC